jgi:hypothetical protein
MMRKRETCIILLFLPLLLLYSLSEVVVADNSTNSLEYLQSLVNNPSEAKIFRKKFKNLSKKEIAQFTEVDKVIKKEITSIASSLPMTIDKYTTWETAALSGKQIAFKYTVSYDLVDTAEKKVFISEINNMLKNSFCSSPSAAWLIMGYTWSYFYYGKDGSYYGGIIVDAKTCGFE